MKPRPRNQWSPTTVAALDDLSRIFWTAALQEIQAEKVRRRELQRQQPLKRVALLPPELRGNRQSNRNEVSRI